MFSRKAVRRIAYFGIASTLPLTGWVNYHNNDLFRRDCKFWYRATPIFCHYKYKELMFMSFQKNLSDREKEAEYNLLHKRYGNEIYEIVRDLRGFYVKIGQLAAQRLDIIPLLWAEKLKKLENELPPRDFKTVKQIIEENSNQKLEDIFCEFDETPIGSASIGQVHRARLSKTKEVVAVKVLDRETRRYFPSDLKTLKRFTRLAQPQILPFVRQWDTLLKEEFDCRKEAEKMKQIRRNLACWDKKVAVPRIYDRYTTDEVLVMEYFSGPKLSTSLLEIAVHLRERRKRFNAMKLDLIKGNSRSKRSFVREFANEAMVQIFASIYETLMNVVNGIVWIASLGRVGILIPETFPMKIAYLRSKMRTLVKVHAYELFNDGLFNPDPHGGNILLLPDGRLGLVDYGQATRVGRDFRLNLARMIVGIDDERWEDVADSLFKIGFRTENDDFSVRRDAAKLFFGYGNTGRLVFPQYMEQLFKKDPLTQYPPDLFMAGKLAMIVRGHSMCLWNEVSIAKLWRRWAEKLLWEEQRCKWI